MDGNVSGRLTLTFDEFGADLSGTADAWDAFATALKEGESNQPDVVVEVLDGSSHLTTSRAGATLVLRGAARHFAMLAKTFENLADAGRQAGPRPGVPRHTEIEEDPYLEWVARGSLPVHLVCNPPEF